VRPRGVQAVLALVGGSSAINARGGGFRAGALPAANLGHDADTTGAVYGQLAGAFHGEEGIPAGWRSRLALLGTIEEFADRLHDPARG
jgi:ADP-ribosyl-[dinitrogen reductase] hydrolase